MLPTIFVTSHLFTNLDRECVRYHLNHLLTSSAVPGTPPGYLLVTFSYREEPLTMLFFIETGVRLAICHS